MLLNNKLNICKESNIPVYWTLEFNREVGYDSQILWMWPITISK